MTSEPQPFEIRRQQFAEAIGSGLAIIPAGREANRNDDVDYPFRQESDFFFLTGFPEPDAVAVLDPAHPSERYVLFVRPRDREMEIWNGHRAGVEGAQEIYGADAAYPLEELDVQLRRRVLGHGRIFYRLGNPAHDERVVRLLGASGDQRTRTGVTVPDEIVDPRPLIHELRLVKTAPEIERLRRACDITAAAHAEAMRYTRPGLHEYHVQAALEFVFRSEGSPRDGYPSIVASGPNACILHYTENRRRLEDGDLLLVDAGAEYGYFSADITRTFPVSGRFSPPQRAVYEGVLAAQRAAISLVAPGVAFTDLHATARRVITESLVDAGLLPLGVEESLRYGHDREFYMHGTSHWLGMDVHDAGTYRRNGTGRPLQAGMAFTVEPGMYVDATRPVVELARLEYDEDAERERSYRLGARAARDQRDEERRAAPRIGHEIPPEFLGIGVRIEDDILVTPGGYENLTAAVATGADEVEALCAESPTVRWP